MKKVFINEKFLFMNGIAPKCLETFYQSSQTIFQKMDKIGVPEEPAKILDHLQYFQSLEEDFSK